MSYIRIKVHTFDEMPKESDIHYGYVMVVSFDDGYIKPMCYTVEKGWNTSKIESTGQFLTESAMTPQEMAKAYDGWMNPNNRNLFLGSTTEQLVEIMDEVGIELLTKPETFVNEDQKEYWDELSDFYDKLEDIVDHAELIEKIQGWK